MASSTAPLPPLRIFEGLGQRRLEDSGLTGDRLKEYNRARKQARDDVRRTLPPLNEEKAMDRPDPRIYTKEQISRWTGLRAALYYERVEDGFFPNRTLGPIDPNPPVKSEWERGQEDMELFTAQRRKESMDPKAKALMTALVTAPFALFTPATTVTLLRGDNDNIVLTSAAMSLVFATALISFMLKQAKEELTIPSDAARTMTIHVVSGDSAATTRRKALVTALRDKYGTSPALVDMDEIYDSAIRKELDFSNQERAQIALTTRLATVMGLSRWRKVPGGSYTMDIIVFGAANRDGYAMGLPENVSKQFSWLTVKRTYVYGGGGSAVSSLPYDRSTFEPVKSIATEFNWAKEFEKTMSDAKSWKYPAETPQAVLIRGHTILHVKAAEFAALEVTTAEGKRSASSLLDQIGRIQALEGQERKVFDLVVREYNEARRAAYLSDMGLAMEELKKAAKEASGLGALGRSFQQMAVGPLTGGFDQHYPTELPRSGPLTSTGLYRYPGGPNPTGTLEERQSEPYSGPETEWIRHYPRGPSRSDRSPPPR